MFTSPKEDRPKRFIIKPSKYQITSSDEATPKKVMKSGGRERNMTITIELDIADLRRILQDNFSHTYNNNLQTQYISHTHQAQPHISTPI